MMTRLLCLFLSLTLVTGYKFYQDEVPNGDRVPHPCKANYLWPGLGHRNELGGGSRNPFGLDFAAAGRKWTKELCNKDSDGDGKTNGAELGDPDCIWTTGKTPANADGISHPGVCEPVGSAKCNATNDWDFCNLEQFTCNATKEPDVTTLTLRIDETSVPPKETTYICQHFVMPTDKDYHVIASKPEISNEVVMHHILLFGCDSDGTYKLNNPHDCGMSNGKCSTQIAAWTVGMPGICWPDELGTLIGNNSGFSHFMIQLHWNNPQKLSTYKDNSGLTLHITPKLRKYSEATFTIGQLYMNIPPGKQSYEVSASCRSSCSSKNMNESFFVYSGSVHMHYLGKSGSVEHYRGGKKIGMIVDTPDYSYDRPESTDHKPPIEFKPGDEMKLKCEYKSTSRTDVTTYGDGTQEEMCYGFIGIFPASAAKQFKYCIDFGSVDLCKEADENFKNTVIGKCHLGEYLYEDLTKIGEDMWWRCNGLNGECPSTCKKYVDETLNKNPCRQEPAKDLVSKMMRGIKFVRQLDEITEACKLVTLDNSAARYRGQHLFLWVILFAWVFY